MPAACDELAHATRRIQEQTLLWLIRTARNTRFGRDHEFASIRSVADFQRAVPIRTYEALWEDYLRDAYPVFDNLTWPGRIPFLALTSGTTEGATKYIPVSAEMVASNRKAAQTALAFYLAFAAGISAVSRQDLLSGWIDRHERARARRFRGRPERDRGGRALAALTAVHLSAPGAGPGNRLGPKARATGRADVSNRSRMISGVPGWLLLLFQRVLELTGKTTLAEVWPHLELVVHGGVKFDPYRESFATILGSPAIRLQETYPCSEGFIAFGDPATGLLRLVFDHGLFYEFVPVDELGSHCPTRHWLGRSKPA